MLVAHKTYNKANMPVCAPVGLLHKCSGDSGQWKANCKKLSTASPSPPSPAVLLVLLAVSFSRKVNCGISCRDFPNVQCPDGQRTQLAALRRCRRCRCRRFFL